MNVNYLNSLKMMIKNLSSKKDLIFSFTFISGVLPCKLEFFCDFFTAVDIKMPQELNFTQQNQNLLYYHTSSFIFNRATQNTNARFNIELLEA